MCVTCRADLLEMARAGAEGQTVPTDNHSLAHDLEALRAGNSSATARVARRYWARLQGLVRPRIRWYGRPAVSVDEDDVANAALNSVIIRLRRRKYPGINDDGRLWRLLARVATRKAGRLVKQWQKRRIVPPFSSGSDAVDSSRSPASRVAAAEAEQRLMDALLAYRPERSQHPQGEELVQLVRLLADGHEVSKIADQFGVARCTVHRWLKLVRQIAEKQGIVLQVDGYAP